MKKLPEQGTPDAQQDREDPPSRVRPRSQKFRHHPDDQSEYNPAYDRHDAPFVEGRC